MEANKQEVFEQIDKQISEIRSGIESEQALISEKISLLSLQNDYQQNTPFLLKIQNLQEDFKNYRKVRGDGSCFYRALIYRILEYSVESQNVDFIQHILNKIDESKTYLLSAGFENFVIEDFHELLVEQIKLIQSNKLSFQDFFNKFNDINFSNQMVIYMRFICSGYIKKNPFQFEPYLDEFQTIDRFVQQNVDPIDVEADQIQITALINYLEIPLEIVYLDSNENIKPQVLVIYEGNPIHITLLYRPGHYDILYK